MMPSVRVYQWQLLGVHRPARAVAGAQVGGDEVGRAERRLLADGRAALGGRLLGGQVLAPGDRVHAEGLAIAGDQAAEAAEPDDAERRAVEVAAEADLPAAVAERLGLQVDAPGGGHDQIGRASCRERVCPYV